MVKYALGAIESPVDVRNYKLVCGVDNTEYPKTFELPYLPEIKDQGATFSCVAHALAWVAEYFNFIQERTNIKMSTEWFYGNRKGLNYRGKGMVTSGALKNFTRYGAVPETLFKGNNEVPTAIENFEAKALDLDPDGIPNRITRYFAIDSESAMKSSLMQNGPIVIAVTWREGTEVTNGILRLHAETPSDGGHCMVIYGWNETGWKIANSWGKKWGNKGTCVLPFDEKIREIWGVEDTIVSDKMRKSQMEDCEKRIVILDNENKELKVTIEEYSKQIFNLNTKINDLSLQIFNLEQTKEQNNALQTQIQTLQDTIKECEYERDTIKRKVLELSEIKSKQDVKINEYETTIKQLNSELEVIKPFNSEVGQFFAKIINAILNFFRRKS